MVYSFIPFRFPPFPSFKRIASPPERRGDCSGECKSAGTGKQKLEHSIRMAGHRMAAMPAPGILIGNNVTEDTAVVAIIINVRNGHADVAHVLFREEVHKFPLACHHAEG